MCPRLRGSHEGEDSNEYQMPRSCVLVVWTLQELELLGPRPCRLTSLVVPEMEEALAISFCTEI